eukprot:1903773-Prymnesium_polylepis.1
MAATTMTHQVDRQASDGSIALRVVERPFAVYAVWDGGSHRAAARRAAEGIATRVSGALRLGKRGPPTPEATTRLAAWALRSGGGYSAVQGLCRDMNMPAPSLLSFQRASAH